MPTPDYQARRTVAVGGTEVSVRVHVSGGRLREEADLGAGSRVTIHGLPGGRAVVFDPQTRRGSDVPAPTRPRLPTRATDTALPGGGRLRVQEAQSHGRWLEVSRTSCGGDGVMRDQSFVSIDPRGREVSGTVRQADVQVVPQPQPLFEVPPDVTVTSQGLSRTMP